MLGLRRFRSRNLLQRLQLRNERSISRKVSSRPTRRMVHGVLTSIIIIVRRLLNAVVLGVAAVTSGSRRRRGFGTLHVTIYILSDASDEGDSDKDPKRLRRFCWLRALSKTALTSTGTLSFTTAAALLRVFCPPLFRRGSVGPVVQRRGNRVLKPYHNIRIVTTYRDSPCNFRTVSDELLHASRRRNQIVLAGLTSHSLEEVRARRQGRS